MDEEEADLPFGPAHAGRGLARVALGLAAAFLAGSSEAAGLRERGRQALGRDWPWLPSLALRIHFAFGSEFSPDRLEDLQSLILGDPGFAKALADPDGGPRIRAWFPLHAQMASPVVPGLQALPQLATLDQLADWLELSVDDLDWFADPQAWRAPKPDSPIAHYRYHWRRKRDGGLRLIEAPKPRLRRLQRRILHGLLDPVPVHPAAMGCVRGRGVIDHAGLHAGQLRLVKLDLRDFYPGIRASRIHALFRSLGYPTKVARYLTGLTTHCSPPRILHALPFGEYDSPEQRMHTRRRAMSLCDRHLPQGAPSSPALANLCAYRLDLRLAGAARACGARYSRYVDDLCFSGAFDAAQGHRILAMIDDIVREEGFEPNWRKAAVVGAGAAQRLTGLTVNRHPNLPRAEYDRLKAILTNCQRHGPSSQNKGNHRDFRAHLQGRVAWACAVNPARGEKLRSLFDRIDWRQG